jgi:hypothetical protein
MECAFRSNLTRFLVVLAVFALFLVLPPFVGGQATSGVTGVVTDQSGAIIVGAEVELANSAIAFSATTTTNGSGAYQFLHVPPGTNYRLTFTKDQFRTVTLSNLDLGVGVTETKNASLEVGSTTEKVEVEAIGEGTVNTVDAN